MGGSHKGDWFSSWENGTIAQQTTKAVTSQPLLIASEHCYSMVSLLRGGDMIFKMNCSQIIEVEGNGTNHSFSLWAWKKETWNPVHTADSCWVSAPFGTSFATGLSKQRLVEICYVTTQRHSLRIANRPDFLLNWHDIMSLHSPSA